MKREPEAPQRPGPDLERSRPAARTGKRRPANSLSRTLIVDAALELLSKHGFTTFSMPKLACELGCGTMSLYGHVESKEHLLDLVVERLWGAVPVPVDGEAWDVALAAQMRGMRAALLAHPGTARIMTLGKIRSATIDRHICAGIHCLRAAGFDDATAVRAYFSLLVFTLGSAVWESPRVYEQPRQDFLDRWDVRASGWSTHAFPDLCATLPYLKTIADPEQFEFAFAALMGGLKATAAAFSDPAPHESAGELPARQRPAKRGRTVK